MHVLILKSGFSFSFRNIFVFLIHQIKNYCWHLTEKIEPYLIQNKVYWTKLAELLDSNLLSVVSWCFVAWYHLSPNEIFFPACFFQSLQKFFRIFCDWIEAMVNARGRSSIKSTIWWLKWLEKSCFSFNCYTLRTENLSLTL